MKKAFEALTRGWRWRRTPRHDRSRPLASHRARRVAKAIEMLEAGEKRM